MNLIHQTKNQTEQLTNQSKRKSTTSISTLSKCLEAMKISIRKRSSIAAIIDNWETLAGKKLAQNCHPLRIQQGTLFIGAENPQWRQALLYNRMKLLASIKASGHKIKDIKIQQYHPSEKKKIEEDEMNIWGRHPSRIDVHGIAKCSFCGNPAPAGEMALWGYCGLCRRNSLNSK